MNSPKYKTQRKYPHMEQKLHLTGEIEKLKAKAAHMWLPRCSSSRCGLSLMCDHDSDNDRDVFSFPLIRSLRVAVHPWHLNGKVEILIIIPK